MESIEWDSLNECNSCHEMCLSIFRTPSVTYGECIVDREMKPVDMCPNCNCQLMYILYLVAIPSFGTKLPVYSMYK